MYLAALHVQDGQRREDWHAYLHRHVDALVPPFRALSVPQANPGVLVAQLPAVIPAGGNAVLSYLDIIVDEREWLASPSPKETTTSYWQRTLDIGELMAAKALPWVVAAGAVHVMFNANGLIEPVTEYASLLATAMRLWESWRLQQGLR